MGLGLSFIQTPSSAAAAAAGGWNYPASLSLEKQTQSRRLQYFLREALGGQLLQPLRRQRSPASLCWLAPKGEQPASPGNAPARRRRRSFDRSRAGEERGTPAESFPRPAATSQSCPPTTAAAAQETAAARESLGQVRENAACRFNHIPPFPHSRRPKGAAMSHKPDWGN